MRAMARCGGVVLTVLLAAGGVTAFAAPASASTFCTEGGTLLASAPVRTVLGGAQDGTVAWCELSTTGTTDTDYAEVSMDAAQFDVAIVVDETDVDPVEQLAAQDFTNPPPLVNMNNIDILSSATVEVCTVDTGSLGLASAGCTTATG